MNSTKGSKAYGLFLEGLSYGGPCIIADQTWECWYKTCTSSLVCIHFAKQESINAFDLEGQSEIRVCVKRCGTSQGSVLGSILFIIFINYLFSYNLNGWVNSFAVYTVLSYASKSVGVFSDMMQKDLNYVGVWFACNRTVLNATKTTSLIPPPPATGLISCTGLLSN